MPRQKIFQIVQRIEKRQVPVIGSSQRLGTRKNSPFREAAIHSRKHLLDGGLRKVADGAVPDDNVITGARERELGRVQTEIPDTGSRVVAHGNLKSR